ncbi:MAG: ribosome maturation factor RimM [Acidobacteriota bacterium]|nr:ribosome maturation factor RimM [Acidobacteriota bacterium]
MPEQGWGDMVLVGRIARPHGIRGEVVIDPSTDFPEERFAEGATVFAERGGAASPMTVAASRMHAGRPIVRFQGTATMDEAELLRGFELRVPESALGELPENVWYHHQLLGSAVRTKDGQDVGTVTAISGPTERSILVIDGPGGEALVPLVAAFCTVDVAAKEIVIDPPEGLIEANRGPDWRARRKLEAGAGDPAAE